MNNNIKQKLSEYLEFDVNLIINTQNDYATIFGGAIRDIIANKEIHDVDILCLSESEQRIRNTIEEHGYICDPDIGKIDMTNMYSNIHCIFKPYTFFKNNKIIQLIKPNVPLDVDRDWMQQYDYLLSQVDLSCCGVNFSYNGLKESVKNAILHCKYGLYIQLKDNIMHSSNRIYTRMEKLDKRGWKDIMSLSEIEKNKIKKLILRDKKLKRILS